MTNPIFRFIASLFRFIRAFIFSVGFLIVFGVVFVIVKSSQGNFETPAYSSKDQIYLKLPLDGELLSKSPESDSFSTYFMKLFQEDAGQLYVFHLKSILERAKADPQVLGLYLDIGNIQGPMSEFTELRKLIMDFKSEGKRVEVWSPNLENKTFYLASLADRIHLAPEGQVFVPGPMFELIYAGDAFHKLGVAFDVIRAGQFKSAFEPLIADQPSAETQKAYNEIEEGIRLHMLAKIATGRKVERKKVEGWLRHSMFSAKEAFAERMVDGLSYREQFEKLFGKDTKCVEISKYQTPKVETLKKTLVGKEGIAFIEAIGEMYIEHSALHENTTFDFDRIHDELKWAREDENVKSVVLRIDSPGGSSLAADLLWEDVRLLAETKPVVVSMGAYAASGGYYMSAPATKIFAHPTTITGSIGVISLVPNFEAFKQKYGLSVHIITGSDRKNLLNPGSKMTAEDRAILANQVRSAYETFVNRVASGRKRSFAEVDAIGQGRVWTGEQAKAFGLVDEIGGLPEAFHAAKELAKLDLKKQYPILHYEAPGRSLGECLRSGRIWSCVSVEGLSLSKAHVPGLETLPFVNTLGRWIKGTPKETVLTLLLQHPEMQ